MAWLSCLTSWAFWDPRLVVGIPALPNYSVVLPVISSSGVLASWARSVFAHLWCSGIFPRHWCVSFLSSSHLAYVDGKSVADFTQQTCVANLVHEFVVGVKVARWAMAEKRYVVCHVGV